MAATESSESGSRDDVVSLASKPKVCLFSIITPSNNKEEHFEDVYVFDLDPKTKRNPNPNPLLDHDLISVSPALRYIYKSQMARCVVNETLYLFEGSDSGEADEKSVYTYDLSSSFSQQQQASVEPKPVSIGEMKKSPSSMKGLKRSPCAILTPNGEKILVFSKVIVQFDHDLVGSDLNFIDFELYDYVNEMWVELPPLPLLSNGVQKIIRIESYYFVDASTFVIHTKNGIYSFGLHLKDKDTYWESYSEIPVPLRGEISVLGGGGLCISESSLYNRHGKFFYEDFPRNPNVEGDYRSLEKYRTSITAVDHRHGHGCCACNDVAICVLYIEFDEEHEPPIPSRNSTTMYTRVYIDVHELNLAATMDGDGDGDVNSSELTPTKTRSYSFDLSVPYWTFWPGDVLPVSFSRAKTV